MSYYVKCIKSNDGNTYCYDPDKKCFVRITETEVPIRQLPEDVIIGLVEEHK